MRNALQDYLEGFIGLFFPRLCLACGEKTPPSKEEICISCNIKLPKTKFHLQKENQFTERFWGRIQLQTGSAMYLYSKGGRTQHLIYNLKYNQKPQVGQIIGRKYGKLLRESVLFQEVELIVPVPLHLKKERIRGYNQSIQFGEGLSESMDIPLLSDGLKRTVHSTSQTKKGRLDRLENVMKVFEVDNANALEGKHVLLVDDVLTTGATLEACATKILELKGTKVSMATIALSVD